MIAAAFALAAAGLGVWVMQSAARRGWRLPLRLLALAFGAGASFGAALLGSLGLFDLIYPFTPRPVPEDSGLLGLVIALGNAGGGLQNLSMAAITSYVATGAWTLGGAITIWRVG
ncbi:MAG: hypothetical protein AAF218_11450 [Pseudomonadota bacterium]